MAASHFRCRSYSDRLVAGCDRRTWILAATGSLCREGTLRRFQQRLWGRAILVLQPARRRPTYHLRDLVKHGPRLADRSRPTPYWSSRNAPTSVEQHPQNRSFKNDWIILVSELFARGYFAKVAGYECPDGDSSADVNAALSRAITRRLHISNLWPPRHILANYRDDNVFYSLVEVLHDLAARPRLRTSHDFNGCRGHYLEGSLATGQAIYRWKVNQLLEESSSPYRLAEEGEDRGRLVRNFDDPRRELLEAAPVTTDPTTTNDVEHAIALFRKRGATREDKRSACVALARVFEARERLVRKSLLKGDADQLFRLANKFDLRHRDGKQYEAYGEEFQDWIFWNYLSTVELTNRLIDNQP